MSIQKATTRRRFARLRQTLLRLAEEIPALIQPVLSDRPVIKGSVYNLQRRCGKARCTCTRGELHRSTVLSSSQEGRTRLQIIPHGHLTEVRQRVALYQKIRRVRARLVKTHSKMIEIIDQIEAMRREEMK
jgi:hypothetical protein